MENRYVPCLLDPRSACVEDCRLREVAEASRLYDMQSGVPVTQSGVVELFNSKSPKQVGRYIGEKLAMYRMNEQLDKCQNYTNRVSEE